MGFLDELKERARRLAYAGNDSWYVAESHYILEIQASAFAPDVPFGFAYMVLPLGPEHYSVSREFRQSVTPTVGGLIAEERGLLWRSINVSGSFGLEAKTSPEFALAAENPGLPSTIGLSGPGWTKYMIRNFFEAYGRLKANPQYAADTRLIWHDAKTDDHWVVVPEMVNVDRNAGRRLQYPYDIRLKAIADADALFIPPGPASLFSQVKNAIAAVIGRFRT